MSASRRASSQRRATFRRALAAASLVCLVSACGLFAGSEPQSACPRAQILAGADLEADYRPNRVREPSALRYVATLKDLSSSCRYEEVVEVDLAFNVLAERGPALDADTVELTYFVATVGPEGGIRSKQLFRSALDFEGARNTAGVAEQLTLRLPRAARRDGPALRIYLGLQGARPANADRPRLLP